MWFTNTVFLCLLKKLLRNWDQFYSNAQILRNISEKTCLVRNRTIFLSKHWKIVMLHLIFMIDPVCPRGKDPIPIFNWSIILGHTVRSVTNKFWWENTQIVRLDENRGFVIHGLFRGCVNIFHLVSSFTLVCNNWKFRHS